MKKLVIGAAAAGGAALAARQLARGGRALHQHCRQMMRAHCAPANAGCRPR